MLFLPPSKIRLEVDPAASTLPLHTLPSFVRHSTGPAVISKFGFELLGRSGHPKKKYSKEDFVAFAMKQLRDAGTREYALHAHGPGALACPRFCSFGHARMSDPLVPFQFRTGKNQLSAFASDLKEGASGWVPSLFLASSCL